MKAVYKGSDSPLITGREYEVRIIYDDDCGYAHVYILQPGGYNIKCSYDGKKEMEKEWMLI